MILCLSPGIKERREGSGRSEYGVQERRTPSPRWTTYAVAPFHRVLTMKNLLVMREIHGILEL